MELAAKDVVKDSGEWLLKGGLKKIHEWQAWSLA